MTSLAALAWQQTSYWRDSETLWTHALNCTSRNFMAHYKLGKALERDGMPNKAIEHYRAAVEIKPRDAAARNDLATLLAGRGEIDAAIDLLQLALKYMRQRIELYDAPVPLRLHYNLAVLLHRKQEFDSAIEQYKETLVIEPDFTAAKTGLARAQAGLAP